MDNVEQVIKMLGWDNDEDIQQKGIKLADQLKNLQPLILPDCNKSVWENCAKVLSKKSDATLQPYLLPILEWLQDITWPGALIMFERLKSINPDLLTEPFIHSVEIAKSKEDEEWIYHLSGLLENKGLMNKTKRINPDLFLTIKDMYEDFWGKELNI